MTTLPRWPSPLLILAFRPLIIQYIIKAQILSNNRVIVIIIISSVVLIISRWLAVFPLVPMPPVPQLGIMQDLLSLCFNFFNHLRSFLFDHTHLILIVPVDLVLQIIYLIIGWLAIIGPPSLNVVLLWLNGTILLRFSSIVIGFLFSIGWVSLGKHVLVRFLIGEKALLSGWRVGDPMVLASILRNLLSAVAST